MELKHDRDEQAQVGGSVTPYINYEIQYQDYEDNEGVLYNSIDFDGGQILVDVLRSELRGLTMGHKEVNECLNS